MRKLILAAAICAMLAACGGNDNGTSSNTTTTAPDPAVAACRQTNLDIKARKSDEALQQLTLSRDQRIATAATKVDSLIRDRELDPNAVPPDLDMEYAEALLELARACKAAGYLP